MKEFSAATPKYELARAGDRFWAYLLDMGILLLLSFPFSSIVSIFDTVYTKLSPDGVALPIKIGIVGAKFTIGCLVTYFYMGYFYKKYSASPGKHLLGLKVICLPYAHSPGYREAVIRDIIGKFISVLTLFIGHLMVLFRADRRALHDLIADTQVVKRVEP